MFRYDFIFQTMKLHIHYGTRLIQFMDITHLIMEIIYLEGNSAIKLCAKSIILGIFHLDTYFIYEIHKSRGILKINIL
jgi:hypothetical protein